MIEEKWHEIRPSLVKVLKARDFDLSLPCVVVRDGEVFEMTLSALSTHLNASAALSSPLMTAFNSMVSQRGAQAALDVFLNSDQGEEFAEVYEQAKSDVKNGSMCSIDDIVKAIDTARDGFTGSPKKILTMVVGETGAEVLLVGGSET